MFPPRGLVRTVLWPLHERLRGRATPARLRWLQSHDCLDAGEMQALHDELLVAHLQRVARVVPYYRDRVDADLVRRPEDLQRFPVISKDTIREHFDALKAEDHEGPVLTMETGGSSGQPLRFLSDPYRECTQLAVKARARAWWGLDVGARLTELWGSPIELGKVSLSRRLAAEGLGYQLLSAFQLSDATMAGFAAKLEGGRCDLLYGYASVIARYARWLLSRGETVRGPKLIITTAETLLEPDRAVISEAFGAPVANEYGCRDGGLVAHEAPEHGLVLMHDALHVEALGSDLEPVEMGEVGEVALTNLHAQAFPLVRYRVGDRIALDPTPPTGRGAGAMPRVRELAGRATDLLERPDGSEVHALGVIYVLRELQGVDRFRCVQHARDGLLVEVIALPGLDRTAATGVITTRLGTLFGAEMRVTVKWVEALTPLASGKHRYVLKDFGYLGGE